jgi:nucleoside-diphosphate-sugar epimerase
MGVLENVIKARGLSKRTILLVGGGGYIGIPVTSYLLGRGYCVRCLDLFLYGNDEAVGCFLGHPSYEFLRGDITDRNACEAALKDVTDILIPT